MLLDAFTDAARARGALAADATPDFPAAAALVRDMPYARAADRRPETVVAEWRGTCSGKHYALAALAAELEVPVQVYHGLCRITREAPAYYPEAVRAAAPEGGLIDVHTFLRAHVGNRWVVVDVTWPADLAHHGFPANVEWDGLSDMRLALPVEREFVVRGDPQAMKDRLIAEHCGAAAAARDACIQALVDWAAATFHA